MYKLPPLLLSLQKDRRKDDTRNHFLDRMSSASVVEPLHILYDIVHGLECFEILLGDVHPHKRILQRRLQSSDLPVAPELRQMARFVDLLRHAIQYVGDNTNHVISNPN